MPWSPVKQLRTVLETDYSIDNIFDREVHNFATSSTRITEKLGKEAQAKSEKVNTALGFTARPFVVTDQNTATCVYYREMPLPW